MRERFAARLSGLALDAGGADPDNARPGPRACRAHRGQHVREGAELTGLVSGQASAQLAIGLGGHRVIEHLMLVYSTASMMRAAASTTTRCPP